MSDLADYGHGSASDSAVTALARLQQAWYRRDVLGVGMGVSPNTKQQLQSYLPEGRARTNFLSECAYDYAEQRIADQSHETDLTIIAGRLRHNMLSSQPMCFNLFSDIKADVDEGQPNVHQVVGAMFPEVPVASVDSVVVEEVPASLAGDAAHDKTGWDAVIRCNNHRALITIETKYTDRLDPLAPETGNDALFDVAERVFTAKGLDHYRDLRRKPPSRKRGQPAVSPQYGGFDQLARNLLLTLRYAEAHHIEHAVNYVLAPAFDTEAETKVRQLRERLQERWRQRVQYRTIDALIQAGWPFASTRVRQVFDAFTTRYLNLNPARQLLGLPTTPYPPTVP